MHARGFTAGQKKTVENQDWATGSPGRLAVGPWRAAGRRPLGLRAAGPLGRGGPWAAGLLLVKPDNFIWFYFKEPSLENHSKDP